MGFNKKNTVSQNIAKAAKNVAKSAGSAVKTAKKATKNTKSKSSQKKAPKGYDYDFNIKKNTLDSEGLFDNKILAKGEGPLSDDYAKAKYPGAVKDEQARQTELTRMKKKSDLDALGKRYKAATKYDAKEENYRRMIGEYDKWKRGDYSNINIAEIEVVEKLIKSGEYDSYKRKWESDAKLKKEYEAALLDYEAFEKSLSKGIEFDENGNPFINRGRRRAEASREVNEELVNINNVAPTHPMNISYEEAADRYERKSARDKHSGAAVFEGEKVEAYEP